MPCESDIMMSAGDIYDLCVVGAGMIGSAAARHASAQTGVRVCLVGPSEPKDRQKADIFGSHYDEGRISRRMDVDPFYAHVARESIRRYRDLERQSGVRFYEELGCLIVGPEVGKLSAELVKDGSSALADRDSIKVIDAEEVRSRFPYIQVNSEHGALLETKHSGYINPRRMVQAQKIVAKRQGCTIFDDVVDHVTDENQSEHRSPYVLSCKSGRVIRTRKLLICTGAFTAFRSLLPTGVCPELSPTTHTIVFAEVPVGQLHKFRGMPSMLYGFAQDANYETPDSCYILPPMIFPDGKYYLKMGHTDQFERTLNTHQEVIEWYRMPPPLEYQRGLLQIFRRVFHDFVPKSICYDTCLTSGTHNRRPFLDLVGPTLGVALGGNGYAAKSSDELGRIAAELIVNNKWDCPHPKEEFAMRKVSSKL